MGFLFNPRLLVGLVVMAIWCNWSASAHAQLTWVQRGPGPINDGQVEGITDREVVGAVNAVTPHPNNADVVYIGTTNGGIWRTEDARAARPHWDNLTTTESSLSIGALEFDPYDQQHNTLVAGIGRTSSLARFGSARSGLLRTTDGGQSWTRLDGGGKLIGLNISGVAPRCSTIVISVNAVEGRSPNDAGIWRSIDSGVEWVRVSGAQQSGLPLGRSFDLVGDPEVPTVFYTNAGGAGIFRTTDTGATWTKIGNNQLNQALAAAENCEIAVGRTHNVFVVVAQVKNHPSGNPRMKGVRLAKVFFSDDDGATWTDLGVPTTTEAGGKAFGVHPGGQAGIHLSMAADLRDSDIVYIGGDRQPDRNEGIMGARQSFPNSIGAQTYSARSFRGNASVTSNRWVHLTHTQKPNGGGTASNSAPHADSRDMDVDVNGDLLEGCDGGIYRRTSPQDNTGDWVSMNGDLVATEFHAVSWDAVSNIVIGGAQDNGSPESRLVAPRWDSISGGDGAVTLVDDVGIASQSIRYSSAQFLIGLRRRRFDANNVFMPPARSVRMIVVNAFGQPLFDSNNNLRKIPAQFYTPLALNLLDSDRILFGGSDTIYESFDQGDTAQRLTTQNGGPVVVNDRLGHDCLAYGASDNEDAFYAGSGNRVFVRTAAPPRHMLQSTNYPGGVVQSIVIHPDEFEIAFVADHDQVFRTDNAGAQWTDVTNNLANLNIGVIHAIAYRAGSDQVIVGGQTGVASATGPGFNHWDLLGNGLPHVPIYHLEYDAADDLLLAGTLGRGAWTLTFP